MAEENAPLMDGHSSSFFHFKRNKPNFIIVVSLTVLTLVVIASTIAISVTVTRSSGQSNPPQPCEPIPSPPLFDATNDFPLYPHGNYDIAANHPRLLNFTTEEGTWMSLDLSPDGTEIVFDLLGDLYVIPYPSEKPRFSPNGKYVLFVSDISGCDNIWMMERTSGASWMVSNEQFHTFSNPMFAPDGQSIFAVKWYTSTRSIPAGEIWKYAVDYQKQFPSNGQKIIGRVDPDAQVGPEEPIISPDYRYLYYSMNTMDYTIWNYNKDPHQQIYTIQRFDFITNKTQMVTGGPGGAARPILSHNNKLLAFIRREEFNTSLIIRDLDSGNEVIAYDLLSPDEQESTGFEGSYPRFSWTPADDSIVIWAKGKIVSINVSSGIATAVPFSANVSLQLAPTRRSSQDPRSGSSFSIKVVTWPSIVDSAASVIYTAVGYAWVKNLPSGTPARLTSNSNQYLEHSASFSSDGSLAVYVLWSDQNLGTIQVISLKNNNAIYNITTRPGRYFVPRFSHDSTSLVYSLLPEDDLSGKTFSLNPGIYVTDLNVQNGVVSASNNRFIIAGQNAYFSATGKSLFLLQGDYPDVHLDEIEVATGNVLRTLASSIYATDIRISPDLQYILFVEFQNVYFAPYVFNGSSPMVLSSRPGYESANLKRLTPNSGDFISWSFDSSVVRWTLSSTLNEVAVTDISTCADISCISSKTKAYDLSFQLMTNIPDVVYVFDNATLVTMNGYEILPNYQIVVQGDTIISLNPAGTPVNNSQALVYNLAGGYVFPGFIDVHSHFAGSDMKVKENWQLLENLAFGVTTLHNPSADTISVFGDAELARAGRIISPRIFSTGTIIYGAGGPLHCEIGSVNDALSFLNRLKAFGGWSVKSYNQPCRAARLQILAAANQLNMNVVPEGGMAFYWNLNQIIDGHTTIEHSIPVAPLYNDMITLFAWSGTGYTPTLIVNYGGIWGERYWYQHTNVWEDARLMNFAPEDTIRSLSMRRVMADDLDYHHFVTSASVKAIQDAGGIVEIGAHGQMQGLGYHWELHMFSQGGIANHDVLRAATIQGAKALGLDQYLGSLAPGKLADLIFFNSDSSPLDNITNTAKVSMVLKDGILYDAFTLNQLGPTKQTRPPGPQLNTPHL